MPWTQAEIETYEKRGAATHEAGHLTVAVASGNRASAWIFRNENPKPDDKTWLGKCECCPDAMVAVAGIVAEHLDSVEFADEIHESIDLGCCELSPTDAAMVGDTPLLPIIEGALAMLRKHRAFFDWAVRELVEGETVTDGMAADAFESLAD